MAQIVGKRAVSPLMATLILISFSVAIGALLMNWTSPAVSASCENVAIDVQRIADIVSVCLDKTNWKVKFIVKNTGRRDLDFLILRLVDESFNVYEYNFEEKIATGQTYSNEIFLNAHPKVLSAEIVPAFKYGNEKFVCSDKSISIEKIPECI